MNKPSIDVSCWFFLLIFTFGISNVVLVKRGARKAVIQLVKSHGVTGSTCEVLLQRDLLAWIKVHHRRRQTHCWKDSLGHLVHCCCCPHDHFHDPRSNYSLPCLSQSITPTAQWWGGGGIYAHPTIFWQSSAEVLNQGRFNYTQNLSFAKICKKKLAQLIVRALVVYF